MTLQETSHRHAIATAADMCEAAAMLERFRAFQPLFDAFRGAGHQIFFVGGVVRDHVMGDPRVGDVDLATDAVPDETKAILVGAGFKAFPIGEKFGTITTLIGTSACEITTFRVGETYRHGSRHPEVRFGRDLVADLSRRDLSINAMAMDASGAIVDPFEGRRGIRERILEVPGGGRENTVSILRDDPLRILRIARFAARFGFEPTVETSEAAAGEVEGLTVISRERWKAELDKLLVAPHFGAGVEWLDRVGALEVLFPECREFDPGTRRDLIEAMSTVPPTGTTRWAVLLAWLLAPRGWAADAPAAAARLALVDVVADRMRCANRERRTLRDLLAAIPDAGALPAPWTDAQLRRLHVAVGRESDAALDVIGAVFRDDPRWRAHSATTRDRLRSLRAAGDPTPRLPPGFGNTVAEQLGLIGSEIGRAIERVRDAILDGEVPNGAGADLYLRVLRDDALRPR